MSLRGDPARRPGRSLGLVALAALGAALACRPVRPGLDRFGTAGGEQTAEESAGPGGHFRVFRPEPLAGPYPVVVFSVGTGGSPEVYHALLTHWASHGLVVIVGDDGMQREGDQALEALAWPLAEGQRAESPYAGRIDAAHVAAAGHSQGGNAAIHVALRDARVRTVLAIEPGEGRLGGAPRADEHGLAVPVLYLCGENDEIVPPAQCEARFAGTTQGAWMAVRRGADHFAPVARREGRDDAGLRAWTTRWLLARLRADADAAAGFDGPGWTMPSDPDWTEVDRH